MENLKCLFTNFPLDIFLFTLVIGLLLWWLFSKILGERFKSHSGVLEDRINFLEGELEACRKSKVATQKVDFAPSAVVATPVSSGVVAPVPVIESSKKDDLKIVEGIGPKIEELCNVAGIFTFAQLAATSSDKIKEILDNAGSRFQMHDPTTWPDQAALARDGKFEELKTWQDDLNKGRVE